MQFNINTCNQGKHWKERAGERYKSWTCLEENKFRGKKRKKKDLCAFFSWCGRWRRRLRGLWQVREEQRIQWKRVGCIFCLSFLSPFSHSFFLLVVVGLIFSLTKQTNARETSEEKCWPPIWTVAFKWAGPLLASKSELWKLVKGKFGKKIWNLKNRINDKINYKFMYFIYSMLNEIKLENKWRKIYWINIKIMIYFIQMYLII